MYLRIKGNKRYLKYLERHLGEEHPKTKNKTLIVKETKQEKREIKHIAKFGMDEITFPPKICGIPNYKLVK